MFKKLFFFILLFTGFLIIGNEPLIYSQCNCTPVGSFPSVIDGVTVSQSGTGDIANFGGTYTSCGISAGPFWVGQASSFTATFTFSSPVNNVNFAITASSTISGGPEFFTFTVNNGTLTSSQCATPCPFTQVGNTFTNTGDDDGTIVILSSTMPYTSITVSGPGGSNGSLLGLCFESISTPCGTPLFPTANNTGPYCVGDNIQLNSPSGSGTYSWTGPGGYVVNNVQNPIIPSCTNSMAGSYTVMLTDADGCTGTATTNVSINPSAIVAFSSDFQSGCGPLCVNFTDQSSIVGSSITNWLWNMEGQNPSSNQNEIVCFANSGNYDVALTVTTLEGCSSTLTLPDYISVSGYPIALFTHTPQLITDLHSNVTFINTSLNGIVLNWDFGDGSSSNATTPTHHYSDTGTYCITLVVINNDGCTDTIVDCIHIQPEYIIYIPNTFTVNSDHLNEVWQVFGTGIKSINVVIFDVWGEEIYSFNDILEGWPGTKQNGAICKQGVYVYKVFAVDISNTEYTLIGRINLIK